MAKNALQFKALTLTNSENHAMVAEVRPLLDLSDEIATRTLSEDRAEIIRAQYKAGRFDDVFPAGSKAPPALMVGRESQIAQLSRLYNELVNPSPQAGQKLMGVVIHGPRGTGKSALLEAFGDAMAGREDARWVGITGNNALSSGKKAVSVLVRRMAESSPEGGRSYRVDASAKLGTPDVGQVELRGATENRPKATPPPLDVEDALRALLLAQAASPLLLTVDEAHEADLKTLGSLLNAVQNLADRAELRVGIALAGTPDLMEVLRDCGSTWVLDRAGADKRLVPMPNDLPEAESYLAVKETLKAAGVSIKDEGDFAKAIVACKGSPYFLQALGEHALESASRHDNVADFAPGGEVDAAFLREVRSRYVQTWNDLDGRGLTGCARQLGALWRWACAKRGRAVTASRVERAIISGLRHPPTHKSNVLTEDEAKRDLKHLGLLWAPSGAIKGPWEMGLPSFFDYVEDLYHDPDLDDYLDTLPALMADEPTFILPENYDDGTQGSGDGNPTPPPSKEKRKSLSP